MIPHRRQGFRRPTNNNRSSRSQSVDSTGPNGSKVRGSLNQVVDKYTGWGNDAVSAGNSVLAQSHFQHAEHYRRQMNAAQESRQENRGEGRNDGRQDNRNDNRNDSRNDSRGDNRNDGGRQDNRSERRGDNRNDSRGENSYRANSRAARGGQRHNRNDREPEANDEQLLEPQQLDDASAPEINFGEGIPLPPEIGRKASARSDGDDDQNDDDDSTRKPTRRRRFQT